MTSDPKPRVAVRDLSKTFYFYRQPIHRFTRWLTRGRYGAPTPFHALRDISFTVPAGTSTGIIGVNGAGKSTLLKIITGTMEPTTGTIALDGRIASLLELGTGFHPLFTGRQNIVYNARFLGLSDDEIEERLPEIEAFSELGDFLDRPLRTYSSGMHVRLAFSVAASVNPDVLVVDEVLAVGDAYFQPKCVQRIRDFRDRGVTILFVSHDPTAVKSLCDRAILLHDGRMVDDASPAKVLEHYNAVIARKKAESDYLALEERKAPGGSRSGTFGALVNEVELLDPTGAPVRAIPAGSAAVLRVRVFFFERVHEPTIGVVIRDRLGNEVWGTNTHLWQLETGDWEAGTSLEVRIRADMWIGPGDYSITAAVHTGQAHLAHPYDWLEGALAFRIVPPDTRRTVGTAFLRPEIDVGPVPGAPPDAARVLARAFGQIPSTLEADGDGKEFLRSGWYAVENPGPGAYRWTDRECSFLLSIEGPDLCLDVAVTRPPGAPPVTLTLLSLGRELGRVTLEPDGAWQQVRIPLPADFPSGPARVQLMTSDAWRPLDTGDGADSRSLGVRIRRIWSIPAVARPIPATR
jgi:lipopolysaccharide transport system ATP-binding protein